MAKSGFSSLESPFSDRHLGTYTKYHGDQAQTKKSRQAFEALVKQQKARVIIQHEKADYDALPAFPAYLE
jgi:hypothetical protein